MTEETKMNFASLTSEMPYFLVVLSAFVNICSSSKQLFFDLNTYNRYKYSCLMVLTFIEFFLISTELFDEIAIEKVPTATLACLERILLLLQDVCQSSDDFCMTLGRKGFIQGLDDMVHIFSIHELYSGLPQVCI